jgi:hypothetical protein
MGLSTGLVGEDEGRRLLHRGGIVTEAQFNQHVWELIRLVHPHSHVEGDLELKLLETLQLLKNNEALSPCQRAIELVQGVRQQDYGHPLDNWGRITPMWSIIVGKEITLKMYCLMMITHKIARALNDPNRDSLDDVAGYVEAYWLALTEQRRREKEAIDGLGID